MLFLDLRIGWAESSDFGPNFTTWAIGFSIRFYLVRFCSNIGLHTKTDVFFRSKSKILKVEIRSHKNRPYLDVKMWRYQVDVVPNLPKHPVPVSILNRYPYQPRYRSSYRYRRYRHPYRTEVTELSGTGIDVVPKFPKCSVPVLTSYPSYRRVRYRY